MSSDDEDEVKPSLKATESKIASVMKKELKPNPANAEKTIIFSQFVSSSFSISLKLTFIDHFPRYH